MALGNNRHFITKIALRDGRTGVQIERMLRALSFVFHDWYRYIEKTNPQSVQHGMPIIAFDKLATSLTRTWDSLWNIKGVQDSEDIAQYAKMQNIISFPSPFIRLPAKHGPRAQLYDGQTFPNTIPKILWELSGQEIIQYFQLTPHQENGIYFPDDYRTAVGPAYPDTTDWSTSLSVYTELERESLQDLAQGLRHLNVIEIRVLGTHESNDQTIHDVQWELEHMIPHIESVLEGIKENKSFHIEAQEMLEYAQEACKKSETNEEHYKTASEKILSEISNPTVRQAFETCQQPADSIWTPAVAQLAGLSRSALNCSQYLTALGFFKKYVGERNKDEARSNPAKRHHILWDDGYVGLATSEGGSLVAHPSAAFMGNSDKIVNELDQTLLSALGSILGKIKALSMSKVN